MKTRLSFVALLLILSLAVTGCFSKSGEGVLKGTIQESPDNDVTKLTVSFAGNKTNPGSTGAFSLPKVKYGTYDLVISEGDDVLYSQPVRISSEETVVTVFFGGELPVKNGSFEEPLVNSTPPGWGAGWTVSNRTSFAGLAHYTISDEFAIDGDWSFRLDGSEVGETVITSDPLALVIPGFSYTASVQIYAESTGGWHPNLFVVFWDKDFNRLNDALKSVRSSGLVGEWEELTVTEVAPEEAVYVGVYINGNTNYAGVSYWDDVKIEVARPGTEVDD